MATSTVECLQSVTSAAISSIVIDVCHVPIIESALVDVDVNEVHCIESALVDVDVYEVPSFESALVGVDDGG